MEDGGSRAVKNRGPPVRSYMGLHIKSKLMVFTKSVTGAQCRLTVASGFGNSRPKLERAQVVRGLDGGAEPVQGVGDARRRTFLNLGWCGAVGFFRSGIFGEGMVRCPRERQRFHSCIRVFPLSFQRFISSLTLS